MSAKYLLQLNLFVRRVQNILPALFGRGFPPLEPLSLVAMPSYSPATSKQSTGFSLQDLIGDGILWAVPKHRRTLEKRLKRKFRCPGKPGYYLLPKQTLRACNKCGHDYEVGKLCYVCYKKVETETKAIQDKLINDLGLSPVEKDVVVLYDNEKAKVSPEYYEGKRIIEMNKPRPFWFSKNLLQKTAQEPAKTKEIKPTDLS